MIIIGGQVSCCTYSLIQRAPLYSSDTLDIIVIYGIVERCNEYYKIYFIYLIHLFKKCIKYTHIHSLKRNEKKFDKKLIKKICKFLTTTLGICFRIYPKLFVEKFCKKRLNHLSCPSLREPLLKGKSVCEFSKFKLYIYTLVHRAKFFFFFELIQLLIMLLCENLHSHHKNLSKAIKLR